jgi:hypothetical protein
MLLFPKAHATSLLRRDNTGRTLFFPVGDEKRSYAVADAEAERRIFRQLRRIRFAEIAAWIFLPAAVLAAIAVTDGQLPSWLFILVFVGAMVVIQWTPDWARRRLAHGLDLASEEQPKPSLLARLPYWAIIVAAGLAVGLAIYFGGVWPLKALVRIDEIGPAVLGSKALAKLAIIISGTAAVLWGGARVIRNWLRPSGDQVDRVGTDE